ncbi:MAG: TolC family protein [Verrucomicrobiota bacterium]|nr:TolC family protein [Verrucomicrobiota bacterium]
MKQTTIRSVLVLAGVGLVAGFSGCATKPATEFEAWAEPRPLGKELVTFRPPRAATNTSTPPRTIEEPTGGLTLRQALALALVRNPDLAAFSWDVRIGETRILQAGLRPNPEAGVEVEDVLGTGDFQGVREAQTTLALSQLIELGGKRTARVNAARFSRDLAGWDYEKRRIELFTQTAEAFVEVLNLQQRLALAEETVGLAEKAVEAVNKRVEAARTFAVEGTKAQVALASVQIERDQTQRALEAARQRLASNWGNSQPRFERVEGNLESTKSVPDLERLLERLRQNPDIARWATEISQREANVKLEKSRRVPDVTVGGGYRRLSGPEDNAFVAGVSIPLPFFNKNQGNIKEAEYQLAKAGDEQRATELRVKTSLGQAWQRLAAAAAEVTALKGQVLPGAQQSFDTVSQYYTEGRLGYLEVLDAQRTLFASRSQYFRALSDYHQAVIAIERLIGEPLVSPADQP